MPYLSAKQRAYMHAKLPEIAKQWDAEIRRDKKRSVKKAKQK